MSDPIESDNVELLRRAYEHVAATGALSPELTTDDVVWDMSRYDGWPEDQTYQGRDAADAFLSAWLEPFEDWSYELESLQDAGDRVVVIARQRGRAKGTGADVDMRFAQISTIRDGRQVRIDVYSDVAEALRVAGIEP